MEEQKINAADLRETSIGKVTPPDNIDDIREKIRKADHENSNNTTQGDQHNDYKALKAVFLEVLGTNKISVEKQTAYKKRVGM